MRISFFSHLRTELAWALRGVSQISPVFPRVYQVPAIANTFVLDKLLTGGNPAG